MITRTTVYLNDDAYEAYKKIPRGVSVSAIVRWVLIALVTPEKELKKKLDASKEGQTVAAWLRENVVKKLNQP